MCEPFLFCLSDTQIDENSNQPLQSLMLPLTEENCRNQPSQLAEFANQIQFNIAKKAKLDTMINENNLTQRDSCTKWSLQRLPDYHHLDLNEQCESEKVAQEECDNFGDSCIEPDCELACAGAHYVTFRIDDDPGSAYCEPMVVNETYPGLAAYIRQILDGKGTTNAIYGFDFEPCYESAKKPKKNPYDILYPSVIENLLNKLFLSSSLSPEDMEKLSNFISILSRLNIEDLNAYFRMLRVRGVVLADVIDNFRKQFWELKNVNMSKKEIAIFLKNVKHAVFFGDPNEAKKRQEHRAKEFAKALEEALQQAEQWARELLGKKLTWSSGKNLTSQVGKIESKTETKPLVPILSKPTATAAQKEAMAAQKEATAKQTVNTSKPDAPPKSVQKEPVKPIDTTKDKLYTTAKTLVIKKETDPKFQLKKDDMAVLEEPTTKKDLLRKEAKESPARKEPEPQGGMEGKAPESLSQKEGASKQIDKTKKEKVIPQEKLTKPDETTMRTGQAKTDITPQEPIIKKDETSQRKSKQEPTPISPIAANKKDETSGAKDDKLRGTPIKSEGLAALGDKTKKPEPSKPPSLEPSKAAVQDPFKTSKIEPLNTTPLEPSKAALQDPSKAQDASTRKATKREALTAPIDEGDAKKKKKNEIVAKGDVEPKADFLKTELVDPHAEAAEKMSTRSMRIAPERDFRMRLAAALSAAQKYADKTLYVPDPHGVEDTPRGTKRFTTADVLESDGKALLRRTASKIYNDSTQLFERFSFLTTGAHQQGYYEPWDVEFPWPDLQELVANMASVYVKRLPDPNFSYRRGMEYYQSIFRRELEDMNTTFTAVSDKDKKRTSRKA